MKRREIMAKQIKDYRNLKPDDINSPEILGSPEITTGIQNLCVQQLVDYEHIEDRDIFFMIQSLFEKYTNQTNEAKVQLVYAFAHLAKGNWERIEKALEIGEKVFRIFVQRDSCKKEENKRRIAHKVLNQCFSAFKCL